MEKDFVCLLQMVFVGDRRRKSRKGVGVEARLVEAPDPRGWCGEPWYLQHYALGLVALGLACEQRSACGVLKHLANTFVGLRRALQVLVASNFLLHFLALLRS